MKRLIVIILAAITLASCDKDDSILFSYTEIGDISGNVITTDNGVRLNIVSSSTESIPSNVTRLVFSCNATNKISNSEYDIELLSWIRVLKKDFVRSGTVTDWDEIGNDPVSVTKAWFSGDYLNLSLISSFINGSTTVHYLNLVLDEEQSDGNTLVFTVRHNGSGESYGPDSDRPSSDFSIGSSYFSSSIKSLFPSGKSSINVKVSWNWNKMNSGKIEKETETSSLEGTIQLGLASELTPDTEK